MQIQISITLLPEEEKDQNIINSKIKAELKKSVKKEDLAKGFEPVFVKKSIDARHGQLIMYSLEKRQVTKQPPRETSFRYGKKPAGINL